MILRRPLKFMKIKFLIGKSIEKYKKKDLESAGKILNKIEI